MYTYILIMMTKTQWVGNWANLQLMGMALWQGLQKIMIELAKSIILVQVHWFICDGATDTEWGLRTLNDT